MGSLAKKGLQQYLLQLQHHPLRTKVPTYLSCAFVIFSCLSDLWVCLVDGKIRDFGGQYLLGNWVGPLFIIYFSFFPSIFSGIKRTVFVFGFYELGFVLLINDSDFGVLRWMQAITAAVLSAVSDIVSQKLSGIQKLQLKRLLLKVVGSLSIIFMLLFCSFF